MAEKNTKPVQGPGGRGPKDPRPKVENPGKLFMRLLAYIMKNYAVHCILVVICIFITVLASVQGTWFMQTLIDGYILPLIGQADPDFSGLLHAIMRVAIFYLIGALASYIYTRIMVNVSQGTLKNLRDDMFTHMEELPIRYFDTHYHGDIMSTYTNDIDTLRQMISQSMPQFLNSIITIVSVFVSMLLLNVPLTIVTLLMIGVTLFATKKIGALSAKYFIAQQKDIATVNGYIEEMMNGQKVVKVFTHEEESIENFNRLNDQLFHSADNANKFGNILMPVNAQIGNINTRWRGGSSCARNHFFIGAMPLLMSSRLGSSFGTSGKLSRRRWPLPSKKLRYFSRSSFKPVHCITVSLLVVFPASSSGRSIFMTGENKNSLRPNKGTKAV